MLTLKFSHFRLFPQARSLRFLALIFLVFAPTAAMGKTQTPLDLPEPPPPKLILPDIPSLTIKAVGDIIMGTNYPNNQLPPQPQTLFQQVQPLLQDADLVFGNFESTLTNYPTTPKRPAAGRVYAFRTPPSYAQFLREAGFNVLSIANNHSYDFTVRGFQDTMRNVTNAGMVAVGQKGQIAYSEVNGFSVAWIAFSYLNYHNSINNLSEATALIRKAERSADIAIVSVHAGAEGLSAMRTLNRTETFYSENRGNLVQFSRAAIDSGADLILGHGPHVPRALELYKGKLVVYSLGNFMGYKTLNTTAELGYSLVLAVELDAEGNFVTGQILPVRLKNQGIPYPDAEGRSIDLIRRLTQMDFPNTPLQIEADGTLVRRN